MSGILAGLKVIEISTGTAGPMVGMLLADMGADVVRVEQPGGDEGRAEISFKVWNRGKRSAELDLNQTADLEVVKNLLKGADIFIDTHETQRAANWGLDYDSLSKADPALIQLSITAYGDAPDHQGRPASDALVAARTGLQWEQRGFPQGAVNRMSGLPDPFDELEVPYEQVQGAPRPGPLFSASKWPSLGAFFAGIVGINAALYVRHRTGKGQLVETSLLRGALAGGCAAWLRAEKPDSPMFDTWILGSKSPKGHFQCADDKWVHNWVPNPRFIITSSEGDTINASPDLSVQNDPDRFGIGPEELLVMSHYQPILAEAVKKFPVADWVDAAAVAGVTMQPVRPVEESLVDPHFLNDGCVVEIDDPEHGPMRQVGHAFNMSELPYEITQPAPALGAHTDEVKAESQNTEQNSFSSVTDKNPVAKGDAPLKGIRVLDLGLAVAGPFGGQQLADLGAEVIKINAMYDMYWHSCHMAYMCNRGKKSIALNLKDPRGLKVLMDLIGTSDVLLHNMRYDAAVRLGIDYDSLKSEYPELIYCHSRGFEKGSPRESLPGNDQTGACLSGIQWEDGGMSRGGKPIWSLTSFGDTGNGFLCAAGVVSALYHRDLTGKGQMVDTSIINACLLNTSYAAAKPDGSGFERDQLDGMQFGMHAGYRLYEAQDGWLCIDVGKDDERWNRLFNALDIDGSAWSDASTRAHHDEAIITKLSEAIKAHSAEKAFQTLDQAGVACEISNHEAIFGMLEEPWYKEGNRIAEFDHSLVGKIELTGLLTDYSETPGKIDLAPLIVGDCTTEILQELGYSEEDIATFSGEGAVLVAGSGDGTANPWGL